MTKPNTNPSANKPDARNSKRSKLDSVHDLVRMLNLLPYFQTHPGRSTFEAAADLGTTPQQIHDDLNRLFCCGPGTFPHELVDLDPNWRAVHVYDSQGMDAPLRLTRTEAASMLLALESLEQMPGLVATEAVQSAATKLRELTQGQAQAVVDTAWDEPQDDATLALIRQAMEQQVVVRCRYHSANARSADEAGAATVGGAEAPHAEPPTRMLSVARLFHSEGHTYVTAWDHEREAHRTFRTDRMSHVELGTAPATPKLRQLTVDAADPFGFANTTAVARFAIREESLWIAEQHMIEVGEDLGDGWFACHAPLVNEHWLVEFGLRHLGEVKILAPTSAANLVLQRAESALSEYDRSGV